MLELKNFIEQKWSVLSLFGLLIAVIITMLIRLPLSIDINVSGLSIFFFAIAVTGYILLIWKIRVDNPMTPWLIASLTIMVSLGIWQQKDPDLLWIGSDVAETNVQAARISLEEGPLIFLETWNSRANPYAPMPTYLDYPEEIIQNIKTLNISWLIGNRWDRMDLPQTNNRMHMHPPLNTVALSLWMMLFGTTHFSAFTYMLFVKYLAILISICWIWHLIPPSKKNERLATAFLLSTAITHLRTFIPHSNDLALFFIVSAFFIMTLTPKKNKSINFFFGGGLICLAIYTNFIYLIIAIATFLILLLRNKNRWKDIALPFAVGGLSIIILFFFLGYYPWLTYITGSHVTKYYKNDLASNNFIALFVYLSISIPLLMISLISVFNLQSIKSPVSKSLSLATISALVINAVFIFPFPPSRYLTGHFFLLAPLLAHTVNIIKPSKFQVATIPFINISYVLLALYLR